MEFPGSDWVADMRPRWHKSAILTEQRKRTKPRRVIGELEPMSKLGTIVADVLGDVFLGIYHMNETSLSKVDWANNIYIDVVCSDARFSNYDPDILTRLIVLCFDNLLRVDTP